MRSSVRGNTARALSFHAMRPAGTDETGMAKSALYGDLIKLYKAYWRLYGNLPRAFRFTSGEQILRSLSNCVALCAGGNYAEKNSPDERARCAGQLRELRAELETVRTLLIVGWELKFASHNSMGHLNATLDDAGRQAVKWRQWLKKEKGGDNTPEKRRASKRGAVTEFSFSGRER